MTNNKTWIRYFTFLVMSLMTGLFFSCKDEDLAFGEGLERIEGRPLDLSVAISNTLSSRGISEESKTSFNKGDLIHIQAEFKCINQTDPLRFYGVYKYVDFGEWEPISQTYKIAWPINAISGSFKAYYLHGSTDALTGQKMEPMLLSDFKFGEDPLSDHVADIEYGRTVSLQMKHIFTYLSLTQMDNGVSNQMFFTIPKEQPNYNDGTSYEEFNNAFQIEFDEENQEINGSFVRVPSEIYKDKDGNGLVYVASESETYLDEEVGEMRTRIGFFLQPKPYHQFELIYPRTRTETASYLLYNRNLSYLLGSTEEIREMGLLANSFYEFSILKSLGVKVEDDPEEKWDDSSPVYVLDVESFIKAVNSGVEYSQIDENSDEEIKLLESTLEGTRLLRNLDFHHAFYDVIGGSFLPNLSLIFDGNFHSISNMACPLFHENNGSIINLSIKNAATIDENFNERPLESNEKYQGIKGGTADFSRNGFICRTNFGTISNVRVNGAKMTVNIKTSGITFDQSYNEAHSAAILFGTNRGNVYNLEMAGNLEITVKNMPDITVMPSVIIGSITGQNLGTISGIKTILNESPSYKVINQCQGINSGIYYVGGIAGSNISNILDVMMSDITVDGSSSIGVLSQMGGVAGNMPLSNSGAPVIEGCIVRGNIKSGTIKSVTNINSHSFTGGVVGLMNVQGKVSNCSIQIGVVGTSNFDDRVIYATGGAFGRIEKNIDGLDGEIHTLACFGSTLRGLSEPSHANDEYIGNFAGLTPEGYTWGDLYVGKYINVKQYSGRENIGGHL